MEENEAKAEGPTLGQGQENTTTTCSLGHCKIPGSQGPSKTLDLNMTDLDQMNQNLQKTLLESCSNSSWTLIIGDHHERVSTTPSSPPRTKTKFQREPPMESSCPDPATYISMKCHGRTQEWISQTNALGLPHSHNLEYYNGFNVDEVFERCMNVSSDMSLTRLSQSTLTLTQAADVENISLDPKKESSQNFQPVEMSSSSSVLKHGKSTKGSILPCTSSSMGTIQCAPQEDPHEISKIYQRRSESEQALTHDREDPDDLTKSRLNDLDPIPYVLMINRSRVHHVSSRQNGSWIPEVNGPHQSKSEDAICFDAVDYDGPVLTAVSSAPSIRSPGEGNVEPDEKESFIEEIYLSKRHAHKRNEMEHEGQRSQEKDEENQSNYSVESGGTGDGEITKISHVLERYGLNKTVRISDTDDSSTTDSWSETESSGNISLSMSKPLLSNDSRKLKKFEHSSSGETITSGELHNLNDDQAIRSDSSNWSDVSPPEQLLASSASKKKFRPRKERRRALLKSLDDPSWDEGKKDEDDEENEAILEAKCVELIERQKKMEDFMKKYGLFVQKKSYSTSSSGSMVHPDKLHDLKKLSESQQGKNTKRCFLVSTLLNLYNGVHGLFVSKSTSSYNLIQDADLLDENENEVKKRSSYMGLGLLQRVGNLFQRKSRRVSDIPNQGQGLPPDHENIGDAGSGSVEFIDLPLRSTLGSTNLVPPPEVKKALDPEKFEEITVPLGFKNGKEWFRMKVIRDLSLIDDELEKEKKEGENGQDDLDLKNELSDDASSFESMRIVDSSTAPEDKIESDSSALKAKYCTRVEGKESSDSDISAKMAKFCEGSSSGTELFTDEGQIKLYLPGPKNKSSPDLLMELPAHQSSSTSLFGRISNTLLPWRKSSATNTKLMKEEVALNIFYNRMEKARKKRGIVIARFKKDNKGKDESAPQNSDP